MSKTFQCPECGKAYPQENRLAGKAVACECGHRFLAPARDPSASSASGSSLGIPAPPRAVPVARPVDAPAPLAARPVARPAVAKPARWADPVPSAEPVPLTEADLFDEPASPPAGGVQPPVATPVFADEQPFYAEDASLERPLPRARYQPPPPVKKKKIKRRSTRSAATTLGMCVAGFVFVFILPAACILVLMAIVRSP
ncbi:MAG TPA: hypothetical protein VN699_17940 [Pirellulales bacterium]|nr:hypothetical protein [Pirellulales bacterium]